MTHTGLTTDAAIFERVLTQGEPDWTVEMARWFASAQFTDPDRQRIRELLEKNRQGVLTSEEKDALQNYERVEHFLAVLRSRARLALRRLEAS
jgi:hypothetical protein